MSPETPETPGRFTEFNTQHYATNVHAATSTEMAGAGLSAANAALIRALQAWFRPSLRGPVHAGRVHARSVVARRAASRSATPTAWRRPTRPPGPARPAAGRCRG